ncbi:D-Ala-D-Ala carboxypeptidase family metallohydrolase [Micromonospora rosaria]|uniref:D-Ala-D-Ala carboxypeptidase family metallohydrolase n=1 Tax=Micromonospora rosaria TaxID=47874 RepID=UPI000B31DFA9|nr:D-Ala-D-Ala carboxypeptidase family metallohydrolase [Micromonospora rosaria]
MSRRATLLHRLGRTITAGLLAAVASLVAVTATGTAAQADGCYTWGRALSQGMSGEDVRQLQIRVSGYPGYGAVLGLDGVFGPATRSAVIRFQQAYGLAADGIAGAQTFATLYNLQDDDCTPVNFTYAEWNRCNSTWSGGAVAAGTARFNALVSMWKLQAMRRALGSVPLTISSGFRSTACNNAVGGISTSRHLYGDGVDLVGSPSFCRLAQQARNHGFTNILGPGYAGHNDHVHLGSTPSRHWSAPSCGI